MGAIFKREFKSYFTSPIGFAILVITYLISGFFFFMDFSNGSPEMPNVFSFMFIIVLIIVPILTMRLFSEDKRQKTDQLLLTAPVKLTSVVLGKFFAAFAVFALSVGIVLVYQILVAFYISPDWMVFFGNLLGTLLFGGALISLGVFLSCLTESQVVAAILCFAIEFLIIGMDLIANAFAMSSNVFAKAAENVLNWMSIYTRYISFTQGTLDYSNIVFFVSMIVIFVVLTVLVNDRRRYA